MKSKEIKIANNIFSNNVFLAPMAGYTDYAFRHLAIKLGAGLTFTELVSAKGLYYKSKGSNELLYAGEDIDKTACQLFGSEEYYMRWACESQALKDFKVVDINMGCPVPKVYKNGEGSALLEDIRKAEKIVKECVKSGKAITVKIRTGQKQGDDVAEEFCKMAENCGAQLVTVHGRVREAYYSGEIDYNAIAKAKRGVNIPVIANGGIFTVDDAEKMLENTGADGVMLARGGIANPYLFSVLAKGLSQSQAEEKLPLKDFIFEQLSLMSERLSEITTAKEFRKFLPYYLKGFRDGKAVRQQINQTENIEQIKELLTNFFNS